MVEMKEFIQGANGQLSSKRLIGFIAAFFTMCLTVYTVYRDPSSGIEAIKIWAFLTGSLLGIGVVEHFKPKDK